jgi:hypothetical protein
VRTGNCIERSENSCGRSKFVSTREGDWLRLAPQANGAGLTGVWALYRCLQGLSFGAREDRIVTDKPHKLAALRGLSEQMTEFEKRRQVCIGLGNDPGEADRDAAQNALTAVVAFFLDFGIESEPLVRLLSELAALTEGSMPSTMLQPAATTHRRQDPPAIAGIKGRLAAVMEHRQNAGLSRKDAAAWVARRLPPRMRDRIGSVTRLGPAEVLAIRQLSGGKRTDLKHAVLSRVSSVRASHAVRGFVGGACSTGKWSDVVPRTNNRHWFR